MRYLTGRSLLNRFPLQQICRKIRDQCFQVELEGQGEVTFVSCAPDQSAKETEDAVFWLERDGEIQYQFPYVMEGNCRPQQSFVQVREVCFQDYDEDENKDVMIVVEYRPLTGTEDQENITEVRLYRNRPDRRNSRWIRIGWIC